MVSQFISSDEVRLLGNIDFDFPRGTHAIGRLDNHSEGLLLLTTDKAITRLLFLGSTKHKRTYLVQVKNIVSRESLQRLRDGVSIPVKNGNCYLTPPCEVEIVRAPETVYPVLEDEAPAPGPHTWLLITLTEGKFHQVRKMMTAVRHRCKRLIRVSIEDLLLADLRPGKVREMTAEDFYEKLKLMPVQPVRS